MVSEKLVPLFTEDESGNTIPWEGLLAENFKFKRIDTSERIYFTTFTDQGGGCYVFSGWKQMVNEVLTDLTDIQPVWLYINDEPYYKKGAFCVGDAELHFAKKVDLDTEAETRETADDSIIEDLAIEINDRIDGDALLAADIESTIALVMKRFDMSGNNIIVNPEITTEGTNKWKSVEAARIYAATQSPTASNQWNIFILPHKNKTTGYAENVTAQAHINFIGLGGLVRITGNLTGQNINSKLINLFWNYDGNLTLNPILAYDCIFRCFQSTPNGGRILTLSNNKMYRCGLYCVDGESQQIISSGSNLLVNCWSNAKMDLQANDKHISYESFNDGSVDFDF